MVKLARLLPLESKKILSRNIKWITILSVPLVLLLSLSEDQVGHDEGGNHSEEGLPDSPQSVGQSFKIEFDGMISGKE